MDLSPEKLQFAVLYLIALILSVAVHEFGHAFVADRLGDGLPRSQGRVTLNPIAHVDPIGTLALPAILLLTAGMAFGWGRPVQINPVSFTRRFRMRTAHMFVALAGPAMNILLGLILGGVLAIVVKNGGSARLIESLFFVTYMNFILAFFNLIPAPPLDGGAVLEGLLPDSALPAYRSYAQYGLFVVMGVMFIPGMSRLFTWPARMVFDGWMSLLGVM